MKYQSIPAGTILRKTDEYKDAKKGWTPTIKVGSEVPDGMQSFYRRPIADEPKKPNPEALRKAIDNLPVSADGKKAVTKLVEEIVGEKIAPEPKKIYHSRQQFRDKTDGSRNGIVTVAPNKVLMVDLDSADRYHDIVEVGDTSAITEEEFSKLVAGDVDDFELIS